MNWIGQILAISRFNLLGLPARKGSVAASLFGIAGVVAVLVGVLSIAFGFHSAMNTTGSEDVAIVLRSGADTEMVSGLSLEDTRLIADAPGIARDAIGPRVASELFAIINLPKRTTGTDANVPLRGVGDGSFAVRGDIDIVEGRQFERGKNEIIVGHGAAVAFAGLEVGNSIKVGANDWQIVGRFRSSGGISESEIWTDAAVLQNAYRRGNSFQSALVQLQSPGAFEQFENALKDNPRLNVNVVRQTDYYANQSSATTTLITTLGALIAVLMAMGAIFGALNTMYSAVASRTREIATLRALGFGRIPIVISVLVESLFIALIGGAIGGICAWIAFDGFQTSTLNFKSFSQVAFAFQVSPLLLVIGTACAALIGMIGGFFPAVRAARLPIALALRES